MVAGTSDAAPRLAPLRARDEKIQQLRRAVAIAILAGDRSTGGGRGDEPDGTRESRADPSDPRSLASFDESETRLSARACAPTRTRCDMQRGGKRTITDETKSTGTGEQSGVSYFVIRHSVPRDFSRDGPRASSLSHSPRRNNARDMSSPFHGGDVGSAIQSAKARGVPMLVALHGASHPRSDALDAAWRRADVASEISNPKRWIALRLEDREGEAGASYRAFVELFPARGMPAVVALNPNDGSKLFERVEWDDASVAPEALLAEIVACREAFEANTRSAALAAIARLAAMDAGGDTNPRVAPAAEATATAEATASAPAPAAAAAPPRRRRPPQPAAGGVRASPRPPASAPPAPVLARPSRVPRDPPLNLEPTTARYADARPPR